MDRQSFQKKVPAHKLHDSGSPDSDDIESGMFAGFLKCDGNFCGQYVAVAGSYSLEYHYDYDPETDEPITHEANNYYPKVMTPAPEIISYPTKLNPDSKSHLRRSFELFWADHGACANRLRIVVEYLLDQLSVPRVGQKGRNKNARLDLADRINLLSATQSEHEDTLNALRHVGNAGSHDGSVDFEDLIDCYELLEDAMVELIDNRRKNLAAKAQAINARKGKPKP
ncbi:hypothetical protein J2766_001065 [Agrobacterium tumefaciens]|uniref:DUF4145 domain-containing protein n=1 Tax=Agrobacterium tumefaciens TaxID=358 RepID=A0AAW8LRP3_AGRTU|nr:DUF4145 domain-containing protein [Agrobacterium tumefaciens]MBP2564506.1 hypothetical protein [Agrobacterium tumefaciens]MDR6701629.1 hypothetical protein [Agrobacterium tumefaciens]